MKKLLFAITLTTLTSLGFAAEDNDLVQVKGYTRYTDPEKQVSPDEMGALSEEEIKSLILETHKRVNAFREENGKPPLVIHPRINWWSQQHSEWMAAHRYGLSHTGADERYRELAEELSKVRSGGENVALINPLYWDAVEGAVKGWINSPGHRANMVGDFNLTGFGVAKSTNGTWWFTQFFIKSADEEFVQQTKREAYEWNGGSAPETPSDENEQEEPNENSDGENNTGETPDINDPEVTKKLHDFPLIAFRQEVLKACNDYRNSIGKRELIEHAIPNYYAQRHSDSIAVGKYAFSDEDIALRYRMVRNYIPRIRRYIEWYAKVPVETSNPSEQAVNQWRAQLGQWGELHMNYNIFGCGISKSDDGNYYYTVIVVESGHEAFQ